MPLLTAVIRSTLAAGLLAFSSGLLALDRHALLDEANILLLPRERELPNLHLLDEQGQLVRTETLKDRWHLLFFGFTACPDVCPTTLSDMRQLLAQLPSDVSNQLQLILVSADPKRDTPDVLRTYLSYYRAGFKGLTGEMEQLQKLSKALGLPFVPAEEPRGDYSVSHSGNLAILGPDGTLRGHIRAPFKLEGLKQALPQLIEAE
ncbi:SCO family protein [Stutzerimonas zhaodongensis]|uniref:SCO family protein n=1 Tax=Stutzerimonas zhaodongensis TaxID=1176257 RepID=A0A3M2HKW6_9GAMM|nr:SCO family protein [Stutzerimonas zhaodongensis]MCQ4317231.1 SCO family protein [Stutzerimonas zhaodongensis]RMH88523.1 SCO family protein [Stutzerimonas zhaodongensis]